MKFFISCAKNDHGKIKCLKNELEKVGHNCIYEWWSEDKKKGKEAFELSFNLVQAIESTELFLCLLPTTRNTAIELGIALSSRYGKRIILWSVNGNEFEDEYANIYFRHPSVTVMSCSFNDLIAYLLTL